MASIRYDFPYNDEMVTLGVREFLFAHSGSTGMGIGFNPKFNSHDTYAVKGGGDDELFELRLLNADLVYSRGIVNEGEEFPFIPSYIGVGETARGNIAIGIMGHTVVNGREQRVNLTPWKYTRGADYSAHGSDQQNKMAMLEALVEGQMVNVIAAKSTGKLHNLATGRGRTASLLVVTPQMITGGPKSYDRDMHPEVADDRSKGVPDWRQPKPMVRDQNRIWARLNDEQRDQLMGTESIVAPEVGDLLDSVLTG